MVHIKTLLPELNRLVMVLAEDLLARATGDAEIDAGLRHAFKQIEKGGRTAQAYEVWREDYLDQVAVAWVLACVFVRFLEDNRLIDECWLAGEGERRKLAEDTHELFFRQHPHDTDREYFQHVFHEVGKIPAARDLFAEGKTPLWAVGPVGRCGDEAAGVLAGDRRRGGPPQAVVRGRGRRHPLPGRPVSGLVGACPEEVRPAANARVRRGVHPRPDARPGHRRVRARHGADDRPDVRLGALPARRVRPAVRPLDEAGGQRDRRRPEGPRRRLGRGHQPVRRGDRPVPADRGRRASLRDQAAQGGSRLEDPPGDGRQPAVRQPLEPDWRKVSEQTWFATDEGSWAPEIYAVRGQGSTSGGARPAVSRRGREPAVHHREGSGAERGVSGALSRPAIGNTRLACRSPSGSSTSPSLPRTGGVGTSA